MFSFTYTPTERYFLTVFILSCALLAIFTGAIYRQSRLSEERDNAVITSYEVMRQTRLALIYALNIETGQRGYLLSRSTDYLSPYNASINELDEQLKKISTLIAGNERQKSNVESLSLSINRLKEVLKVQTSHLKNHRDLNRKELDKGKEAMEFVRSDVNNIMTTEQDVLDQRIIQSKKQQRNYLITLFTGALLALGGLFVANMVIYSLLARNRIAKSELFETEERYKTVMNGINDGMYDYNLKDGSVYYSPSYKAMLGYDENDFKNTVEMSYALIHPDDLEDYLKVLEKYKKGDVPNYVSEFRMRHKNGSWRWILARGIGVKDTKTGQLIRLVGAHTDITVQKEREEELKQLNTDLEGFTYIASHDLRAPLVNIKGFSGEIMYSLKKAQPVIQRITESLTNGDDKTIIEEALCKDIPESLTFIDTAIQKMDKLTNAILDLSRIGRREYSIEDVNVNDIVKRCLNVLAYEISKKNIAVEVNDLPHVMSDNMALEQVFSNVLDNAVKYMDSTRDGKITISSKVMPHSILFSIADNGRGISPNDFKKVFDIFRRAQNTSDVRGVGMGMAYVKATLRKMGGKIWFDSNIGTGTTFYFTLPYHEMAIAS